MFHMGLFLESPVYVGLRVSLVNVKSVYKHGRLHHKPWSKCSIIKLGGGFSAVQGEVDAYIL